MDPSQNIPSPQADLPAPSPVTPQVSQPAQPVPIDGLPLGMPAGPATDQPAAARSPHSPVVADDVDLIEKEWVLKAKAIVAQTKDDPNQQNKAMNRFKADYLKTRYSKDIKVSET